MEYFSNSSLCKTRRKPFLFLMLQKAPGHQALQIKTASAPAAHVPLFYRVMGRINLGPPTHLCLIYSHNSRCALSGFREDNPREGRALRKRELRAEILPGSLDWKEHYEQYGLQIAGLVPNPRARTGAEMSVNHCWRFIRRSVPWPLTDTLEAAICSFLLCFLNPRTSHFMMMPVVSPGHHVKSQVTLSLHMDPVT